MKNGILVQSFVTSISLGILIAGGSKLLNFILKILVSQLGVSNFGDYYLATSTFLGLTTLAALGVPMSVTRFISFLNGSSQAKAVNNIITSAITIIIISSVFVSVIFFIFAETIIRGMGATHTAIYLKILSFGLIGSTITLLARAVFLGFIRIRMAYATEAIEMTLKFVLTISGMLLFQRSVGGALAGFTAGTLLAAFINAFMLVNVSGIKRFTLQLSGKFLRFTLPVSTSEIFTATANVVLLYVLRLRGGAETMGLYAAAVSIAALIHVVPQMMLSVFLPLASNLYAQQKSVLPIYKTLMLWLCVTVCIPTVLLAIFSPTLISIIFGSAYQEAGRMLTVLVIAHAVYAVIAWPNRQLLDMAGYTKDNFVLTTLRVGIGLGVMLVSGQPLSGLNLAAAILWGWVGESAVSILLVKKNKII